MKYFLSALFVLTATQVYAEEAVNSTSTSTAAVQEAPKPANFHLTPSISYTTVSLRGT